MSLETIVKEKFTEINENFSQFKEQHDKEIKSLKENGSVPTDMKEKNGPYF